MHGRQRQKGFSSVTTRRRGMDDEDRRGPTKHCVSSLFPLWTQRHLFQFPYAARETHAPPRTYWLDIHPGLQTSAKTAGTTSHRYDHYTQRIVGLVVWPVHVQLLSLTHLCKLLEGISHTQPGGDRHTYSDPSRTSPILQTESQSPHRNKSVRSPRVCLTSSTQTRWTNMNDLVVVNIRPW